MRRSTRTIHPLREDGRARLPYGEYYMDQLCPHPDCRAVYGRDMHTGDCKATVESVIARVLTRTAKEWGRPLVMFKPGPTGRWHAATLEWWKERLQGEWPNALWRQIDPKPMTARQVARALTKAGAVGECDHGVPFDDPGGCVQCAVNDNPLKVGTNAAI